MRFISHSRRNARLSSYFLLPCLGLLTAFALSGCGRSEPAATPDAKPGDTKTAAASPGTTPTAGSDFKVAVVMSGPISDNGWNAGAFKALQAVQKELNLSDANVAKAENAKTASDQTENLQSFASKKFNVVFGHGHEYEDLALKMEKDFPNTMFVISSGEKVGHNTMPIIFKLEDGAYLLGMVAAGMSKTGTLAEVGAEKIPPVASVFKAFEQGAKAINPNIKILEAVYTGSWDDAGKAKQATLPLIDQGADVIMQDVDAAAPGIFNAVKERSTAAKPVWALGTNSDQNSAAPDVILASAPIYTTKVFVKIAKDAQSGTLKPSDTPFGMPEGIIDFIYNPQLESKLPADLKAKVDEAKKKITDKTLVIPKVG